MIKQLLFRFGVGKYYAAIKYGALFVALSAVTAGVVTITKQSAKIDRLTLDLQAQKELVVQAKAQVEAEREAVQKVEQAVQVVYKDRVKVKEVIKRIKVKDPQCLNRIADPELIEALSKNRVTAKPAKEVK